MRFQPFILMGLMTSCTMYNREFDCPPPKGVCCAPLTTLESMIIESPCGEDAFTGCVPKLPEKKQGLSCKHARSEEHPDPFQRRIWIAASNGRCPTYIYFDEEESCEVE